MSNPVAAHHTLVWKIARWLPAAIGLIVGGSAGYVIGYHETFSDMAGLTSGLLLLAVGWIAVALLIVGFLAAATHRSRLSRQAFLVVGAIAVGAIVMSFAIPALGLEYKAP